MSTEVSVWVRKHAGAGVVKALARMSKYGKKEKAA